MFSRLSALATALAISVTMAAAAPAAAADQVYFSKDTNVTDILVNAINHETVRLDISSWYLSEHSISIAIANRFHAGVPVRLMGDRGAIFEADPHTKTEFYWLASQGIPIRLRFNPTWFPEINHWKMALFVGQNMVEFGSGNFAPTELAPFSPTNYDDESELFTTDPEIVNAFRTKFDQMWNDTTVEPQSIIGGPPYFKSWDDACANEPTGTCADYHTQYPNPTPMVVNTARLEPDYPMPADLIWGQGSQVNNRLIQEINAETIKVDFVAYRLEIPNLMQALLDKFNSGVPVRLIVDKNQYTDIVWPEYWLTHAYIDKLWAAGVPIIQNNHDGVTHEKTIITSTYALNGSSNWGANWQRDHNYFIPKATKPAIWQAFEDNFNEMWNDTTNYGPLVTTPPRAVDLSAAGTVPTSGQSGVDVTTTLTWNRAPWATSYDIWLGTTSGNMSLVATVQAQLVESPPLTYSWTPPSPLNFGTGYVWKVVSRTFANMTATSDLTTFSTRAQGSQPPTVPANPAPGNGSAGVGTTPTLTWTSADATSYAVNFGTVTPPPSTGTSSGSPSYTPGTLVANTTYYWQIIASNAAGSTPGPIWSFATSASNVPAPWQSQDVGSTGQTGSSTFAGGTFTVHGAGADIWGTADGFQFAYQPLAGDVQIIARLTGVQNTNSLAKAGVMLRASTSAGAQHVILDVRPTGDVEFMSRNADGGATSYIAGATHAAPVWLKLVLSGSTVTGSISSDGSTWSLVGTTTITFPGTIDAGLIVSSHDTSTLNTSTFDSVTVSTTGGSAPGTPASPSPANAATGVSTTPTLTWSSSGGTSYDVAFGTSNPPSTVSTGQAAASYTPAALATNTTYFWTITAHNSTGTTAGPVWSFTTASAPTPPGTPASPSPVNAATGVSQTPTLTWTSSGATSYSVAFGTANPPPNVSTGQASASYSPAALAAGTTYFWRITAINAAGSTAGPIWSFSTSATGLPSPWQSQDVGPAGQTGSSTFAGGTFTVHGAGADIWGTADGFQFAYQPLAGDGQIVARLTAVQNTNSFAKAGVMLRGSLSAGAQHVILDLRPTGDIEFMSRNADGGETSYIAGATHAAPVWMKLARSGSTVTGSISSDGSTWSLVGTTTITFPGTIDAGLIVSSHDTATLNTSTFDSVTVSTSGGTAPGIPASPSPANAATGVSTAPTLTWSSSGATSYDVAFGTSNPPSTVSTGQAAASYTPATLAASTTYFWKITAHNSIGATAGPIWSFTTQAPPPAPGTPGSPSPANTATGVSTTPTLTWSAANATSYDVKFGTANPPPQVATGQAAASFSPSALTASTTYFWQIVAKNSTGSTTGPIWSFATSAATTPTDIVIYATDVPSGGFHGEWSKASDATAAAGVIAASADTGFSNTAGPLASPAHYVDVTFSANAGVAYTFWMRLKAAANSKFNDSLFVQFSDALSGGSPVYQLNSTSGLTVNLATDTTGSSLNNWGWVNGAYWLSQPATLTFASSGTHTLRIQLREDGIGFDQLVLSPSTFFNASASCPTSCAGAPGPVTSDSTIVPKP